MFVCDIDAAHDHDSVCQLNELGQILTDEHERAAAISPFDEAVADGCGCDEIEPNSGICLHQDSGFAAMRSRPIIAFRRLPPERLRMSTSGEEGRTGKALITAKEASWIRVHSQTGAFDLGASGPIPSNSTRDRSHKRSVGAQFNRHF
jgi:hypothetical protein